MTKALTCPVRKRTHLTVHTAPALGVTGDILGTSNSTLACRFQDISQH